MRILPSVNYPCTLLACAGSPLTQRVPTNNFGFPGEPFAYPGFDMGQTIRQQDWEAMPKTLRLAAIQGMEAAELAELYSGLSPLPGIGPRFSREEWRAMSQPARKAILPHLESWEAAIVRGWTRQDRRGVPGWVQPLAIGILLAYPVFCAFFALFAGLREWQAGDGFSFPLLHAVTTDVPGFFDPEIPIRASVEKFLAKNFEDRHLSPGEAKWHIERVGNLRVWNVTAQVEISPADGRASEVSATFVVVCDAAGYRVHHAESWGRR